MHVSQSTYKSPFGTPNYNFCINMHANYGLSGHAVMIVFPYSQCVFTCDLFLWIM